MVKELWVNLPVKDVNKSKTFFTRLGFSLNEQHCGGDDSACLLIGSKNFVMMLFAEETFKSFTKNGLPAAGQSTEALFSISVESRAEVDEMAKNVWEAGGTIFSEPAEIQGWMYGCAFCDLDGHRWNVLYMDPGTLPSVQETDGK